MTRRRGVWAAMITFGVVGAALAPAACSNSDDSAATSYSPGDDASGVDATGAGGDSNAPVTPLCESLGGYDAVRQIADSMVAKLSQDCRIGPYFTNLTADQQQHHTECFETFLAASSLCTDSTGAKIAYLGAKDSHGVACKAIPDAHGQLGLTKDDYKAFQQDVVAALNDKQVATDLRDALVGIFNGQPGVYSANKSGNAMCSTATCQGCVPRDAGADADTGAGEAGLDAADAHDGD